MDVNYSNLIQEFIREENYGCKESIEEVTERWERGEITDRELKKMHEALFGTN
jgi:hypothetical protein